MTLPSPPNITQGQIAIDPVNGVLYYRNSSGNIISSTLNLHQTDEDSVDTNNNIAIDNSMSISGSLDVQNLTINGSLSASGSTGLNGQFLRSTGDGIVWQTIQQGTGGGGGGGTGTVEYVNLTVPTGLSVSGGPIVTTGTFAITFSAGYSIPTISSQTNWDTAYNERFKWDGGSSGLVASTGRNSLGLAATDSPLFAGITADLVQIGITSSNEIDTTSGNLTIDSAGGTVTVDDNLTVIGTLTGTLSGNASTATTLSTARNIYGNSFNGSADLNQTITVAYGGTGINTYAVGDILYASTTSALARLAGVATGNALISGGVGAIPSWGKIGLTTHVSGTLPAANGGTGQSTYAVGDILYASTTSALARLAGVATGNALISGGVGAIPSWGKIGLTTHVSGTLPIANGGTNATTAPAAMANLMGYTSTVTAAGTTTLTNTSSYYQQFTGTSTQTVVLPVTSTLTTGWTFHIVNNSTGNLTVNSSGGNLVITVIPGTTAMVTCIGTTLTTAADWEFGLTDFSTYTGTGNVVFSNSPTLVTPSLGAATATTINNVTITQPASSATITIANGKTLTVNNSITFAGTDGTTITMPTTSGTVALDNQTMFIGTTSVAINRASGSLSLNGITLNAGTLTGTLTAAGTTGTAGQVLQSTGTGVQWATVSSGSQSATPDLTNIKSISFPDYIFFNTSNATPSQATGKLQWDPDYGMLQYGLFGGNVNIDIGQEQVVRCFNLEATTINKGEVVYIFGAQGGLVSVKRASNTSDLTSAKTLGVAAENIISSGIGYVATQGLVQKLDLTAFNPGDILWLGSTPGTVTTLKPQAPNHIVFVGVVLRNNAGNGTMFIKPQNGYELDEIHDVLIATPNVNDFLKWNGTFWVNDQINLGSETVGDYVQNLVAGTGITITNNSGEGATPTIAVTANTYQPLDAELTALAGLTSAADALPYFTGSRNCRYDNSNISCKKHIRRYKCWRNKNHIRSWNY